MPRGRPIHNAAASALWAAAAFAASVHAQATTDPCAAMAAAQAWITGASSTVHILTGQEVIDCYSSFSIDAATRKAQVDVLKRSFELYPYADVAKSSASPYYASNVDIIALLDAAASNDALNTEFAFQNQIINNLNSLYDAHVAYSPSCFSVATLMQPFILGANHTDGKPPTIYVKSSIVNAAFFTSASSAVATKLGNAISAYFGDVTQYIGLAVTSINGSPPVDFLQKIADSQGFSKNPQSRFNRVVARPSYVQGAHLIDAGSYVISSAITADMAKSVVYELAGPSGTLNVTAPWGGFAIAATSFTGRDSYYQAFCASSGAATPATPGGTTAKVGSLLPSIKSPVPNQHILKRPVDVTKIVRNYNFHIDSVNSRIDTALSAKDLGIVSKAIDLNTVKPLVSDEVSAFYMLDDTTGVWLWSSISPTTSTGTFESLLSTIPAGLTALEKAGATKLIIDTQGNGGGFMCISAATLQYLFNDGIKMLNYDMRLSASASAILKNADISAALSEASGRLSLVGDIPITSGAKSPLDNPQTITRGGVQGTYTDKFYLDCSDGAKGLAALPTLTKGWSTNAIFLLSDGTCGSACGMFTRAARDQFKVKSFVVGGSQGTVFQPTAFEGGNVINFTEIAVTTQQIVKLASIDTTNLPLMPTKLFPLPVDGQIPTWDSYSQYSTVGLGYPAEWVPENADALLSVTDPSDRVAIWLAAAAAAGNPTNSGKAPSPTGTSGPSATGTTTPKSAAVRSSGSSAVLVQVLLVVAAAAWFI
ncbi:hypothetical protein DFJ73DRAFT_907589 [Zopfochytrium polystomum]|nr:hypothetical protein DFJ73DRAFT_907589 [Zopfochytrium polystomum]